MRMKYSHVIFVYQVYSTKSLSVNQANRQDYPILQNSGKKYIHIHFLVLFLLTL